MDNELAVKVALDISRRRMRAGSIMGIKFRPSAYIPLDISIDKIRATLKEMGYEGEVNIPDGFESFQALAEMPLDFASKRKDSLNILGRLLAEAEIPRVVVACDTSVPSDAGDQVSLLCVASVDLQSPDTQVLIPYQKEDDDDVSFGDQIETRATDQSLRDDIIEGFLETEARIHLEENPDTDTDAYVDGLPTQYPNVNGALNDKGQ
jgi:hypothetical protein